MLFAFIACFLSSPVIDQGKNETNKYFKNLNRVQTKQLVKPTPLVFYNKIPTKVIKKTEISN